MSAFAQSAITPTATTGTRSTQLILGLITMMAISSPQYVWTLFTKPFGEVTGASLPALQVTFTLLIVLQTFFSPVQGYLIDRFSPKLMIALGAVVAISSPSRAGRSRPAPMSGCRQAIPISPAC